MTTNDAHTYATTNNLSIVKNPDKIASETFRREKNGFKSGYHAGLRCHIRGYEHFKEEMKRQNMDICDRQHTEADFQREIPPQIDHEMAKELRGMGANVSDRELDALCRGERITNIPIEHTPDPD